MDGYTWVKLLSWRPVPPGTVKVCHWNHGACARNADFEQNCSRVGKARWLAYCAEHVRAYGHRILGNEVQTQVPLGTAASARGWVE